LKRFLAAILVLMPLAGQVAHAQQTQLSGLALQQVQSRDFEAPLSVVFPAVMTILQDAGFRILSADKETGLITAAGSTEGKWTYSFWWGLGKKKETPVISAFIEQRGSNLTRARLNFVMSTGKSRNLLTDERPITDAGAYREAFEKIEKEVFIRQAMAAPPPPLSAPSVVGPSQPVAPALLGASTSEVPHEWRQATYSPGIAIAFIDAANVRRTDQVVRFWLNMYFPVDQGSDHFIAQREVRCADQKFRDVAVTYFMGKTRVGARGTPSEFAGVQPNTVNSEIMRAACGSLDLGKQFKDPDTAARLYFETKNW
jgi:hypothetical protein